ncbi:MAG: hypothetical protein HY554_09570 [Elusimicrobia bacterium]|nr:hypothetical protein [Elusimicrobiota bacterium]
MAAAPSRRLHARYVCRLPFTTGDKSAQPGALLNIGMGGAYLRVRGTLREKMIRLDVEIGQERMTLTVRVAWSGGVDPSDKASTLYGIEFGTETHTREKVRLIVDRIRTDAAGRLNVPLTKYW